MPAASSLPVNADLEKHHQRLAHQKLISDHSLTKAAKAVRSSEDMSDLVRTLASSARLTAQNPVYDLPRLRHGARRMALGGALIATGIVAGYLIKDVAITDVVGLVMHVATLALMLAGVFLVMTGHDLRTAEHLPRHLSPVDIEEAKALLAVTKEDQRSAGSSQAEHLSRALLTADAAILLWLVAPVLLPNSTPMTHMVVVLVGALLIGKLANDAASAVAVALRKGSLLAFHDEKASDPSEDSQVTAAALRKNFDVAVGGHWPISPSWWSKYRGILPGLTLLVLLSGSLLALRMLLGNTDGDVLTVLIVALLILGTTSVAIALKVRGECLVPQIARAKRILSRFPTCEEFQKEMAADAQRVRDGLISARKVLRNALTPRRHGAAAMAFTLDDLDLDTPAPRHDDAHIVRVMRSPSPTLASSGFAGRPTIRPAAVSDAAVKVKAASGFRPNPHIRSR